MPLLETFPAPQDESGHSDLLIEQSQDIFAREWEATAENYAEAKMLLYVHIAGADADGKKHNFAFLICHQTLELGQLDSHELKNPLSHTLLDAEGNSLVKLRRNAHQVFPMLIFVGDFVDSPEGVIPSGVWALGENECPLLGSKFLFQSLGGPGVWEWKWLPSVPVDSAEWKSYARRSDVPAIDRVDHRFVQRSAEASDNLDNIESDIFGEVFLAACDYMRLVRVLLSAEGVGFTLDVPVDDRFEIVETALSSFDVFV